MTRLPDRTSSPSTAISARSWPITASSATGPTPSSGKGSCGSTWSSPPRGRPRRGTWRSCRERSLRASYTRGSQPAKPMSGCRLPIAANRSRRRDRPAQEMDRGRALSTKDTGRSLHRSGPRCRPSRTASWCRNPIDFFILAKLESNGLEPSPEAERTTLLKRLSLDLAGLPPSTRGGRRVSGRSRERCRRKAG